MNRIDINKLNESLYNTIDNQLNLRDHFLYDT